MALQLKSKVKEEKPEAEKGKKGKYKRKRNVFGKRLTRFGLIGLIIGLAAIFAVAKVVFTISQNNKQKNIDNKLEQVKKDIEDTRQKIIIAQKQAKFSNVGELIATLPSTFDRQATSRDLDRIIILSNLHEMNSGVSTRKIDPVENSPIKFNTATIKAVEIELSLYGTLYDYESVLNFIKYLTDYEKENFYYIDTLSYVEDSTRYNRCEIKVKMYTFYNEVKLSTPTTDTTTNTNTTTK